MNLELLFSFSSKMVSSSSFFGSSVLLSISSLPENWMAHVTTCLQSLRNAMQNLCAKLNELELFFSYDVINAPIFIPQVAIVILNSYECQ